jgi:hypothetical protein
MTQGAVAVPGIAGLKVLMSPASVSPLHRLWLAGSDCRKRLPDSAPVAGSPATTRLGATANGWRLSVVRLKRVRVRPGHRHPTTVSDRVYNFTGDSVQSQTGDEHPIVSGT